MSDNPFEAPTGGSAGAGGTDGYYAVTADAWAEGDLLVTAPEATLPLVCAKCGTTDAVSHLKFRGQWSPMWVRFTILLSPLVYLILHFIMAKRFTVHVGLCPTHKMQRNVGLFGGLGGVFVGLAMIFGGLALADDIGLLAAVFGMGLILVGVILMVVMAAPLRVHKVTTDRAEFRGANPALLRAVSGEQRLG